MGGAYYAGVESPGGYGSYGYVVHADGSVWPASSGSATSLDTPQGTWAVGQKLPDRFRAGDRPGSQPNRKGQYEYWLHPIGTSNDTPLKDPRYKKKDHPGVRTEVMGHVIHGSLDYGSHGCIAVQQREGVDQFGQDGTITVDQSATSLEDAQKKIEAQLGHTVDWSKIKKPVPPRGTSPGDSDRSKTKKGNKIKAEDTGVRLGTKQRKLTYLTAPLESGGQVTKGTSSIRAGTPQYLVSAVTHDTTDGTPIANGEDSIQMIA